MKRLSNFLESEKINEGSGLSWNDVLTELQIAGYKIKEIVKGKKIEAVGGPNPTPDKMKIEWDGKDERSIMIWTDDDNFKKPMDLKSIEELIDELMTHFQANESVEENGVVHLNEEKENVWENLRRNLNNNPK